MTTMPTDDHRHPMSTPDHGKVGYWLFLGLWTSAFLIVPFGMRALTWMLPLSALVLLPALIRDRDYFNAFARPAMTLGAVLVIYGFVTALWSADPGRSLSKASTLLAYLLTGLILLNRIEKASKADLERLFRIISIAFLLVCSLMVLFKLTEFHPTLLMRGENHRIFEGATLSVYNRGISFLVLTCWGITHFWALRYPRIAALFPLATLIVVLSYVGISNQLALIAGLGALAIASIIRQHFLMLLTGLTLAGLLAAPWLAELLNTETIRSMAEDARASALHRLDIWVFTAQNVFDHLVSGWGLGGSRTIPDAKEIIGSYQREQLPSHPHNAALQVWLELGMIGTLIVAALIARTANRMRLKAQDTGHRLSNRFVGAFAASSLVIALLGYGLFQTIWMATLCFSLLLLIASLHANKEGRQSP